MPLGLKVIIDWVPNHTSDRHPWFVDAASGRDSAHRDWYVWRDADPGRGAAQQLGRRLRPDRPGVDPRRADRPVVPPPVRGGPARPQLGRARGGRRPCTRCCGSGSTGGSTGSGPTSIHCIGKDPDLPDDPPEVAGIPHSALNDVPVTHQRLRDIRTLVDGYPGDRVVVGEVYLLSTEAVATYYGDGDELHLAFNFPPLYARWQEPAWAECIDATVDALDPRGAWPTWVLSNHDNPRHRTRYDRAAASPGEDAGTTARRSEPRARAAAVLLMTLRGTPFLYQGEELGLLDAVIPPERAVDPGGRDGCRAPMPWDGTADHGWPTPAGPGPWLPFPPEADIAQLRRPAGGPVVDAPPLPTAPRPASHVSRRSGSAGSSGSRTRGSARLRAHRSVTERGWCWSTSPTGPSRSTAATGGPGGDGAVAALGDGPWPCRATAWAQGHVRRHVGADQALVLRSLTSVTGGGERRAGDGPAYSQVSRQ